VHLFNFRFQEEYERLMIISKCSWRILSMQHTEFRLYMMVLENR